MVCALHLKGRIKAQLGSHTLGKRVYRIAIVERNECAETFSFLTNQRLHEEYSPDEEITEVDKR